jgi:hypothetical protein
LSFFFNCPHKVPKRVTRTGFHSKLREGNPVKWGKGRVRVSSKVFRIGEGSSWSGKV